MKEVKIAELKARLSHYLRLVQDGEEILVKDRERPVARLVGCGAHTRRFQAIPRRLTRKEAEKILAKIPRPKLSRKVIDETMRWMREDRSDRWFNAKDK